VEKLHTNGARFVDTERFDVSTAFAERGRTVGFVGRLDVEKRVPALAEAAKQLPEDVTFVFVGDGDYRDHLERKLAAEIEAGVVDVVGWVDREAVSEQLNRLRLQIVPSHPTEGLPTAILEGMACGTPAYATPVSGVPDVVRDGQTGFLIADEDGAAIAEEVQQILDRPDLEGISERCRETITEAYSFEGAVRRWRGILTDS
jgi:glycosyltransferase involved in cell wall biosynthesis